MEDDSFYPTK